MSERRQEYDDEKKFRETVEQLLKAPPKPNKKEKKDGKKKPA